MSRRASSSSNPIMGPPTDRDVVMAPPQFQSQPYPPPQQNIQKPQADISDKYKKLKRKYFDLEEKFKESQAELQRSGERSSRMRHERSVLLDRIIELEQQGAGPDDDVIQGRSSAFPRSLLPKKAQDYFRANMRVGLEEIASEDPKTDPLYYSRHIGPQARKQQEDELKERQEEEAREARRASKRARVSKGKEAVSQGQVFPYSPAPPGLEGQGAGQGSSGPHVSANGPRLRLKPPAQSTGDPGPGGSSYHSGPIQHHTMSASPMYQPSPPCHNSPSNPPYRGRSQSPMSTGTSPQDEQQFTFVPTGASGAVVRNHYRSQTNGYPADGPTVIVSAPSRAVARASDMQRHAKPKRLKAHTVTSKSHSIPMVPRDKKGRPLLPLNVGIMTVINLGEVCMREHFHTERYIFPVGYEVTRRYLSTVDPTAEVVYHCSILDGGDGPKFKIIATDAPQKPIIAGTATGAWSTIVKTANQIRNRQHSNSVSGPDFFGLAQNTIKHLIQGLPGADKLKDYVWQNFHEGGPLGGRHASVVPALPEEYDGSFTYYEREKDKRSRVQLRDDESDAAGDAEEEHQSGPAGSQTIYMQQEHAYHNERRNSRGGYEDYTGRSPSAHLQRNSSPSVHRDQQQFHFVDAHGYPHTSGNGSAHVSSPYSSTNAAPAVPATFASIMNAYESSPPSPPDFVHHNGGTPAEGSSSNGGGRSHRSRKSGP